MALERRNREMYVKQDSFMDAANEFKVEVHDVITPLSCSAMIIEFIKYIAYQKQLIPYPYERLKMYVNIRKKQLLVAAASDQGENVDSTNRRIVNSKESLASQKYFKKTAAAYDSLENMFKVITDELTNVKHNRLEEVVLLLGTSFTNPQDVYRLRIPQLDYAHSIKTIINSEKFDAIVCGSCCTSSMRVLLKMKPINGDDISVASNAHLYIPRSEFKLPTRGNHAVISFKTSVSSSQSNEGANDGSGGCSCPCERFDIFQDEPEITTVASTSDAASEDLSPSPISRLSSASSTSSSFSSSSSVPTSSNTTTDLSESSNFVRWFQIKDSLTYFADVTINDVSLTDVWMNPEIALK